MTTNEKIPEETEEERQEREEQEAIYNDFFKTDYFRVEIDLNEIDNILTEEKKIVIKQKFSCYCYNDTPIYNHSKFYYIEGDNMTYKYVIQELIKQDFKKPIDNILCNHFWLEDISNTEGSNIQFELGFGS